MSQGMRERDLPGDSGLPPGCRPADLERGVSPLDDCSPARLWELLAEGRQADLYREFFRREWGELSACLDEQAGELLGNSIRSLWIGWRNTAVIRMALAGEIRPPA
jgi:hypothetical protein